MEKEIVSFIFPQDLKFEAKDFTFYGKRSWPKKVERERERKRKKRNFIRRKKYVGTAHILIEM